MRLIDADKIEYTSIAHLASYPVAPSPCDTVMRAEINAMSTVDAVPVRHGKWLCSDDMYETAVCSVCNCDTEEPYEYVKKSWNFCPNCGAKMDGAERKDNEID